MPTTPEELAAATRAVVVAAAGCGKTRLIADAVNAAPDTRQLILTHTHAGVHAVRQKLRTQGVTTSRAHVATIDGFALRWAAGYPSTSGLTATTPRDDQWSQVHPAARRVLVRPLTIDHLRRTYDGIFVDEYQDCSQSQHQMIGALAEALPTRVVGDPMQGIFDFRPDDPLVDFDEHVFPLFERLEDLEHPHRWAQSNPELGLWLRDARHTIESGATPDYTSGPIDVLPADQAERKAHCKELAGKDGSAVVIFDQANPAHTFARGMSGLYQSMEEMECKELFRSADELSTCTGPKRSAVLFEFAQKVVAGLGNTGTLGGRVDHYRKGELPSVPNGNYGPVVETLNQFAATGSFEMGGVALRELVAVSGKKPFRRELLSEMERSLKHAAAHPEVSLTEAAWRVRDVTRRSGRRPWRWTVSRTLLVKGLEYDRAVVMDASQLDPKHLYVALTRGSRSLTVAVAD